MASLFRAVIPLPKLEFRGGLPQLAGFSFSHVAILPPPTKWGSCSLSLLHLYHTSEPLSPFRMATITKTLPHQQPNLPDLFPLYLSYRSLHPLPLQPPSTSVPTTKLPQIHHGQNVGLGSYPPIRYLYRCLEICSLTGDFLFPNRTMRLSTLPDLRPPAEPPPIGELVLKETVLSSNPMNIRPLVAQSPSSASTPIRPTPKPPWTCYCESRLTLASSVLSDPDCVLPLVVYCFVEIATILFVKMPQRAPGFWNSLFCADWHLITRIEDYVAGNHRTALSYYHPVSRHGENLVNLENNNSLIVLVRVKKIICNWIGRKTGFSLIDCQCL